MGSQRVGHDLEIKQHHHSMPESRGEVGIATPALGSSRQMTRTFTSLPSSSHFFGLVWTVNRCRLGMAMPLGEGGGGLVAKWCLTLATPWTGTPPRLLYPWDSLGKNTGVGCHFLLQRIFLTQKSNPGLLQCRQIFYRLSYKGGGRCLHE